MSNTPPFARPQLPKRFYKSVTVAETPAGFAVMLDGRPVKTPAKKPLAVPARALAEGMAAEWDGQGEHIDPGTMPTTRLVNTIIDGILSNPEPVRTEIARFAETDMLFYRANAPEQLVERQREGWDPVLAWAEERLAARFVLTEGVMHVSQPETSQEAVRRHLASLPDGFTVGALHQITTLTGSTLLALAFAAGRLSAEETWALAHLDEDWNIEQWGADDEALALREIRWREMLAAALVLVSHPGLHRET